jgi:cell division protein FtsN
MRHLKADVSHRIKRRPSIFTARWFRVLLGAGAVVVLSLWLGPPATRWLLTRPSGQAGLASRQAILPTAGAADPSLAVAAPRPDPGPAVRTPPALVSRPAPPAPPAPPAVKAKPGADVPPGSEAEPPTRVADAVPVTPAPPVATAVPGPASGLFRLQVGVFRDPRNADRLAEQLRSEGADVLIAGEGGESASQYRLVARPPDGETVDTFVERLRGLGHRTEVTPGGVVVGDPVSVRAAIEATRQLREQGVRVRLERVPAQAAAGLRVVRVGSYGTREEAERARDELTGRGYQAVVVRER